MSYINWNEIMDEIDLDFLEPLLDEVSKIYEDQWQDSKAALKSGDPYGSSGLDEKLAEAYSGYQSQAAKEKTGILTDYHQSLLNNQLENRIEGMGQEYDDLMEEYEDYKDEVKEEAEANQVAWEDRWDLENWWNPNMPVFPYWNTNYYHKPESYSSSSNSSTSNSTSSTWPPGGTIINPDVITNYNPFYEPPTWGGTPGPYEEDYYPPSSPSSSPGYAESPWWEMNPSGKMQNNQGNRKNFSSRLNSSPGRRTTGFSSGLRQPRQKQYSQSKYPANKGSGTLFRNSKKSYTPSLGKNKKIPRSPGFRR